MRVFTFKNIFLSILYETRESEAKVIRQRIAFQKRQERKTVSSFCGVALYFAPNFNVERLAVLVD